MADLMTLTAFKTAIGETTTTHDGQYAFAITAASQAIRNYTDRSFDVTTGVASPRMYQYDGSGYLDIDDCTGVTTVVTDAGAPQLANPVTLQSYDFSAQPYGGPVYSYLQVINDYRGYSPQMGFRNNLDTMPYQVNAAIFTVTATWGWPAVPADVQQALVWTVQSMLADDDPNVSESIAGYSHTRVMRSTTPDNGALSSAAKDVLNPYVRQLI